MRCVLCRFDGENIPVVRGSALCALNGDRPDIGKNAVSMWHVGTAAAHSVAHNAATVQQVQQINDPAAVYLSFTSEAAVDGSSWPNSSTNTLSDCLAQGSSSNRCGATASGSSSSGNGSKISFATGNKGALSNGSRSSRASGVNVQKPTTMTGVPPVS